MQAYEEEGKQEDNNINNNNNNNNNKNKNKNNFLKKMKGQKMGYIIEIVIRALAVATSIAAACITFTSNQTTLVFGIQMDAKYTYSSAFIFLGIASTIASVCSFLSLGLTLILHQFASSKANYHLLFFIHDLVIMGMTISGSAAGTAIGYVGKYGYEEAGWMPICDHFQLFCHKITAALILSYFSFFFFFFLTILSASKSHSSNFLLPSTPLSFSQ